MLYGNSDVRVVIIVARLGRSADWTFKQERKALNTLSQYDICKELYFESHSGGISASIREMTKSTNFCEFDLILIYSFQYGVERDGLSKQKRIIPIRQKQTLIRCVGPLRIQ